MFATPLVFLFISFFLFYAEKWQEVDRQFICNKSESLILFEGTFVIL